MDVREIVLSALMVISAVLFTYRWLSLIYNNADPYIVFFAFLLTLSLGALLVDVIFKIRRTVEELESTKRLIAANTDDLEKRLEDKLAVYMRDIEERLDEIQKRMFKW
jgi:predicted nucleotide-binding protein (sugar kinase/HSP70/actin superfamily)